MPTRRAGHDPESYFPFECEAVVERHHLGRYAYTVVFLPEAFHAHLPLKEHPRLRVSGEVNETPFEGAWQPSKGRWYLMLSKELLRDSGLSLGDSALVRFRQEPQDRVQTPEALSGMLAKTASLNKAWDAATPGARRGFAHHVASAKTPATIAKRLREVVQSLRTGRPLRDVVAAGRARKPR
jgi:hypothetical protein